MARDVFSNLSLADIGEGYGNDPLDLLDAQGDLVNPITIVEGIPITIPETSSENVNEIS